MNQVKFLVTIFLLTLLAAKGQGNGEVNLTKVAGEIRVITSPNFPGEYPPGLNCVWIITAPHGYKVNLTFTELKIEADMDPVKLKDGGLKSSPVIRCITQSLEFKPKTFISTGRQMRLEFESDPQYGKCGFRATCKAIKCPSTAVWGHWGDWSECSLCCGNGTQTRMRNCTNPPCVGDSTESRECNTHPCTVNCTGLQVTADSPFEQDCRRFYRCENDILTCPMCPVRFGIQEWYDPRIRQCNHPCAVNCTTACGIRPIVNKNRIVNGFEAPINGWPWQVRLINKYICGGVLIGRHWVLTAAHCVVGDNTTKYVTLGAHYLNSDSTNNEQRIAVEKCIPHPNYTMPSNYSNDIALLKLARPADLNNAVGLVCIPKRYHATPLQPGKLCYITGWGSLFQGGGPSEVLREASVPIVDRNVCNAAYPGAIDESMLCAGFAAGGTDTCQDDSGGPLVCEHYGKYYIEGITSWGRGCALPNSYGVYANVRNLIPWIWQETKSH